MIAWQQQSPVAVPDVQAEARWSQVAPALVAAQLRAALSVPVELAPGPIGTLEVYAAGPRDWNDREVAALQADAGVVASLLRAAAAATVKGGAGRAAAVALGHRVLIEQAKGVLMEREGCRRRRLLRGCGPRLVRSGARSGAGRCGPGRREPAPPSEPNPTGKGDPGEPWR
jgi:GAF domain-containing protein